MITRLDFLHPLLTTIIPSVFHCKQFILWWTYIFFQSETSVLPFLFIFLLVLVLKYPLGFSIAFHFSYCISFEISIGENHVHQYSWSNYLDAAINPLYLYIFSNFCRMYFWPKLDSSDVILILMSVISIYTIVAICGFYSMSYYGLGFPYVI